MRTFAIIPAAGKGLRFGSKKQFAEINGLPLLYYTLNVFEQSSLIEGVVLALAEEDLTQGEVLIKKYSLKKILKIVVGGKERQESVWKAFKALPSSCECVVVHDGARPFVPEEILKKVIQGVEETGACITGLPVKETIKKIGPDQRVQETVDRSSLWSIQTPQAFHYKILGKALEKAHKEKFLGTDEAMLVERIGIPVKVIKGDPLNIKVTTPEDLKLLCGLV